LKNTNGKNSRKHFCKLNHIKKVSTAKKNKQARGNRMLKIAHKMH